MKAKSSEKKFKNVLNSWATIEHQSQIEFCQAIDNSDFKLECVKMFPRRSRVRSGR